MTGQSPPFTGGPYGAVSFNEWLDAVDGSYCTSDGGDDLNFDPQFPDPIPIPGAFNDHSCGIIRPPNVISVSRGDEESRLTEFYSRRQCNEYAKLGLMGVTVIYGSGNTGTAGATRGYCMDENGGSSPMLEVTVTECARRYRLAQRNAIQPRMARILPMDHQRKCQRLPRGQKHRFAN